MAVQNRNDDLMNFMRGEFQARYEQAFHWSQAVSTYLALPGLRGFWPMSALRYTNANRVIDLSGQGNDLTGNNSPQFSYENLIPLVNLNGTTQFLSRADGGAGNWADVTGAEGYILATVRGLTLYAWVNFDNAAAANEHIIAKWLSTGNQRAYRLQRLAAGTLSAQISVDGIAQFVATTTETLSASTWYFVALQYSPSVKLSAWINDRETPVVAAVPASIFDSNDIFELGAVNTGALQFMDGKQSMIALCAAFHSDSIIKAVFNQTRALFDV